MRILIISVMISLFQLTAMQSNASDDKAKTVQNNAVFLKNFINPYSRFSILEENYLDHKKIEVQIFDEKSGVFKALPQIRDGDLVPVFADATYRQNGSIVLAWRMSGPWLYTIIDQGGELLSERYRDEDVANEAADKLSSNQDQLSNQSNDELSKNTVWKKIKTFFQAALRKIFSWFGISWGLTNDPVGTADDLVVEVDESHLCGYKLKSDTWKIPAEYTECNAFTNKIATVDYFGVRGIINTEGDWLTPKPKLKIKAKYIGQYRNFNEIGLIDKKGQWFLPPSFPAANAKFLLDNENFYSWRLSGAVMKDCSKHPIKQESVWVEFSCDELSKKLKQPEAVEVDEWPMPKAENDQWGFVDKDENWVIKPMYDQVNNFSDGFAAVYYENHWAYINAKNEFSWVANYTDARDFHGGVAWVSDEEGWHLINNEGKQLTSTKFNYVYDFDGRFASASTGGIKYIINKKGVVKEIDAKLVSVNPSAELIPACVDESRCGYLNNEGNWEIEPKFKRVQDFVGDYAIAGAVNLTDWSPFEPEDNSISIENVEYTKDKYFAYVTFNVEGQKRSALINTKSAGYIKPLGL